MQFVRPRVRCPVFPSRIGEPFLTVDTGKTPKIVKGVGIQFEFGFFAEPESLMDISRIASLTLSVKPLGQPGEAPVMLKTISDFNTGLTLEQWENGTGQHAVVVFSALETAIAEADYDLVLSGITNDDALDGDAFGSSLLNVKDLGLTNLTAPAIAEPGGVTMELLTAVLKQYVRASGHKGDIILISPNESVKRILGITNDSERTDSLEES